MDIQRLKDILSKDAAFAVVVGNNYTIDEMGSALSLYLALSGAGKSVSVVSVKQPLVEVSNLVGIDKVKSSFDSQSGDLVVSFPYRNDEIGKVSYTLESGFLNIIVKPKEQNLSFGEKDVIFKRTGDVPGVILTVGVKRLSDLGAIFEVESLKNTTIINIDKASNNEGYGEVVILGQNASSVSEQVANLLLTLGMQIDQDIAQNLMSGIISATGNFQSPKTSSLAFEMAGILLRNGARRESQRAPQSLNNVQPQRFNQPASQPRQRINTINQIGVQNMNSVIQPREFPKEQKKDQVPPVSADKADAPPDWLTPKIFKGSTNVE